MEPESEREALGDRVERASERASGLSSREKYGALSLTLNVSAKRGGDGGAAQRNAVAREARRRAGLPAPAPAVCCCPASCLVPLYPSQSRLPSSENASSPSPSPSLPPFPLFFLPRAPSGVLTTPKWRECSRPSRSRCTAAKARTIAAKRWPLSLSLYLPLS